MTYEPTAATANRSFLAGITKADLAATILDDPRAVDPGGALDPGTGLFA